MKGSGVLTDVDLTRAHDWCDNDPAADPSFERICDLTDVSEVRVSDDALESWADDSISNPPVRHAIVCTAPAVALRVLDYVKLSRRRFREVSIFPNYEKAVEWLGKSLQTH